MYYLIRDGCRFIISRRAANLLRCMVWYRCCNDIWKRFRRKSQAGAWKDMICCKNLRRTSPTQQNAINIPTLICREYNRRHQISTLDLIADILIQAQIVQYPEETEVKINLLNRNDFWCSSTNLDDMFMLWS